MDALEKFFKGQDDAVVKAREARPKIEEMDRQILQCREIYADLQEKTKEEEERLKTKWEQLLAELKVRYNYFPILQSL